MRNHRLQFVAAFIASLFLGLLAGSAAAQEVNNGNQTGFPLWGSLHGSGMDTVALNNGNLHIEIPILSVKQRGGHTFTYTYVYDTPTWVLTWVPTPGEPDPGYWYVDQAPHDGDVGWRLSTPTSWGLSYADTTLSCLDTNGQQQDVNVRTDWAVIDPDGTKHPMALRQEGGSSFQFPCLGNQLTSPSLDGSGIVADITSSPYIVRLKDGTNVGSGWKDANGNFASANSDTLGRNLLSKSRVGNTETWTIHDSNGDAKTFTVQYTGTDTDPDVTVNTGAVGLCSFKRVPREPCQELTTTYNLPRTLTLPNGMVYTFHWQEGGTADLIDIDLPTGQIVNETPTTGFIAYTYEATGWKFPASDDHHQSVNVRSSVISRTVNDGQPHKWDYAGYMSVAQGTVTTTVTNPPLVPNGPRSREEHDFTLYGTTSFETQVRTYSEQGQLLRTATKGYGYEPHPYTAYAKINSRVTSETTTLENGQVAQSQTDYETFTASYPYYGTYTATRLNVTEQREYDYGSGAPGALLRTTDYSYLHNANSTYLGLNIVGRVTTTTVSGPSAWAQTVNEYDNYSSTNYHAPIQSSGATQHDATYDTGYTTRGNLTAISRWLNTSGGALTTVNQYDDAGNVIFITDPGGHPTTISYDDNWANSSCPPTGVTKAYATLVTNTLGQRVQRAYYACTGLLYYSRDENDMAAQRWGTSFRYDALNRIVEQDFPDGGYKGYGYIDPVTIEITQGIDSQGHYRDTWLRLDGLGREKQRATRNDETTPWDQVDTCYDALGRVAFKAYPYQGNGFGSPVCSGNGDSFQYDGLSRTTSITHPDGSSILTTYTGRATRVQDEGNGSGDHRVTRVSQTDALGRLRSVCEETSTNLSVGTEQPAACNQDDNQPGFLTVYDYNVLGNLLTVTQGGLTQRQYTYDSLSRLLTASNPESGLICYGVWSGGQCINGYDGDGSLLKRTDARGITTTYAYDPLHRLTSKQYSDSTPAAYFSYDQTSIWGINPQNPIGRLTTEQTTGTATNFSYDAMGRVLNTWQCTPLSCGSYSSLFTYTYDFIGDLLTANQGGVVTYTSTYNRAGRMTSLTSSFNDANHPPNLLSAMHYNAVGLTSASLGNGASESRSYDARGRVTALTLGPYWYTLSYHPNSDLSEANDSVNGDWTYGYDDFNRLIRADLHTSVVTTSTYVYDRFGNRWQQNSPGGPSPQYNFDANNRIANGNGYTYDAAGNIASFNNGAGGIYYYTYDAENRLTGVSGSASASYVYDAEEHRVRKTVSGTSYDYLYDQAGRAVAEVRASDGVWNRAEAYAGERHVATYNNSTTSFDYSDWLGTERMRVPITGSAETCTSLPFGDNMSCTSGVDWSPHHFTGKERDTESGLDYFGARYYGSTMGRFTSPDPLLNSGHPPDPQSWNRYSYTLNNPLKFIDPTGLYNLVNGCQADDKKCNKKFVQNAKNLKEGLADLQSKLDKVRDPVQKARLQAALKAMGTENDGNNVNVKFGALAGTAAGQTDTMADAKGNLSFNVTLDPEKINGDSDSWAIDAAHEGTHISDISDPRFANLATTLDAFQKEYRGYQTSAWAASALGWPSLEYGGGKYVIWNSSWGAVDDKVLTKYITSFKDPKTGQQTHPETNPHNPWPN